MRIYTKPPYYYINLDDVLPWRQKIDKILNCFVDDDYELLFKCMDDALMQHGIEFENFIKERTVYKNSEWLWPWERQLLWRTEIPIYDWYKFKDKNELLKKFEKDPLFEAVVLKKNRGFDEALYVLTYYEYSDIPNQTLFIYEKKTGDFIKNVVPKLDEVIGVTIKPMRFKSRNIISE